MKKTVFKRILFLCSILLLTRLIGCANNNTVITSLHNVPQNNLAFVNSERDNYVIKANAQKTLVDNYLARYFSPWNEKLSLAALQKIKRARTSILNNLIAKPGWNANMHQHSSHWAKRLTYNANLANFPNLNKHAITINDCSVREAPTIEPSFTNLKAAGKGYPFDNLQASFLPAGTPVHVLHVSHDGSWYLISTPSFQGWVQQQDIAFTTPQFIKAWQTTNYAVVTRDNTPAFDQQQKLRVKACIGSLYPLRGMTPNYYVILTAANTPNKYAAIRNAYLPKTDATIFPMLITAKNIANIANQLLGNPYGWGGIYGYRDCSATMMDLMNTFGIWLPRNSLKQVQTGYYISFAKLTPLAKERAIINYGIPFLSLIHLPGHIVLYIGEQNGHAYVFQDMWGLVTLGIPTSGRAVIGSTVITSIHFGHQFVNVHHNLFDAADGMNLLIIPSMLTTLKQ